MERNGERGMELDFGVVGWSMDGGVSQSTFKAVSEDESVSYKWGMAIYQKENGDKILYLIITLFYFLGWSMLKVLEYVY